ncbi:hypothetical protein GCM10020220_105410 [Nonomuraea rubra]|uniref:hypothetical protein n=1 Tax=Nonomuraea rubra TaxID=46180 RepID=UPI0031E835FF
MSEHAGAGTAAPAYDEAALGPWDFGLALLVDSRAYPPDLKAIHRVIQGLPWTRAVAKAKGSWQVHDYKDLAAGLAALERAPEPAFLLAGEDGTHLLTSPDPLQLARAMPPDHSTAGTPSTPPCSPSSSCPWCGACATTTRPYASSTTTRMPPCAWPSVPAERLSSSSLSWVDDVLAIAAGGERVPRKSTSFGRSQELGWFCACSPPTELTTLQAGLPQAHRRLVTPVRTHHLSSPAR